jgi:hypothetical protein
VTALLGTIVEIVPVDGLGWIQLDSGERIRFGGTACRGFPAFPGVGTRVEVVGTEPGYRGVVKAVMVVPVETPNSAGPDETSRKESGPPQVSWPRFVETHPRWSDVERTCLSPAFAMPPLALPAHPLFAPWYDEICRTAPVFTGLEVPGHMQQAPVEPEPAMSFAHGTTAFLEGPGWPSCGVCQAPMEMCLQLAPEALKPWLPRLDKGFVALFCFHCGVARNTDPRVAHVAFVEPRVRVTRPAGGPKSASSGHLTRSQLVKTSAPRRGLPSPLWYRYRSEVAPDTASAALFGYEELYLTGPFPDGVELDEDVDIGFAFEGWAAKLPAGKWGGGKIGGEATWDQGDATPSCEAHGEMAHFIEYNGGQFLDGALHVFLCRACSAVKFVAEF